jgi:hypothetical protein
MLWGTRRLTTAKTSSKAPRQLAYRDADERGADDPVPATQMRPRFRTRLLGPAGAGSPHSRRHTAYMNRAPGFFAFGPIACSYAESSRATGSSPRHASSHRALKPL